MDQWLTRDNGIVLVAAVLSVVLAWRPKALGDALILAPLDLDSPENRSPSGYLQFRFLPASGLNFWQSFRFRSALFLLYFPFWAVLLNLVLPGPTNWDRFLTHLVGCLWLPALCAGGFYFFTGLFVLLVSGLVQLWSGSLLWSGLILALFAIGVGKWLAENYLTKTYHLAIDVWHGQTRSGQLLTPFGRFWMGGQLLFLAAVPFMMLYETVRVFNPSIDLVGRVEDGWRIANPLTSWPLLMISLGLGLNILFSLPSLVREMMERWSIECCVNLNRLLNDREEKIRSGKPIDPEDPNEKQYQLFYSGRWSLVGDVQMGGIFIVSVVAITTGLRQVLEKMGPVDVAFQSQQIVDFVALTRWLVVACNGVFLAVLALEVLAGLVGARKALRRTVATIRYAAVHPDAVLQVEDGAIVPVEVEPERLT